MMPEDQIGCPFYRPLEDDDIPGACGAWERPVDLSQPYVDQYCLSADHVHCWLFKRALEESPASPLQEALPMPVAAMPQPIQELREEAPILPPREPEPPQENSPEPDAVAVGTAMETEDVPVEGAVAQHPIESENQGFATVAVNDEDAGETESPNSPRPAAVAPPPTDTRGGRGFSVRARAAFLLVTAAVALVSALALVHARQDQKPRQAAVGRSSTPAATHRGSPTTGRATSARATATAQPTATARPLIRPSKQHLQQWLFTALPNHVEEILLTLYNPGNRTVLARVRVSGGRVRVVRLAPHGSTDLSLSGHAGSGRIVVAAPIRLRLQRAAFTAGGTINVTGPRRLKPSGSPAPG